MNARARQLLFSVALCLSCGPAGLARAEDNSWPALRTARDEQVQRYLRSAKNGYEWFAYAAHGREAGVPLVLLRLLPELAPDLWGAPQERLARFGFFDTPDTKDRPLPLGLGWEQNPVKGDKEQPSFHRVTLTCAACHVGRVRTGPDAAPLILVGAPNTEIDVRKYRYAVQRSVDRLLTPAQLPNTIQQLKVLLGQKPGDFFFGGRYGLGPQDEARERQYFLDNATDILSQFASTVQLDEKILQKQLATSYARPNAPPLLGGTPGQSDGSGDLFPKLLLVRELTEAGGLKGLAQYVTNYYPELPYHNATTTDNLSVWNQRNRPFGQLDGSVRAPLIRNIAAQIAVVGSSRAINVRNADIAVSFTAHLPAPPYPFRIDLVAAQRGQKTFARHCQDCHKPGNDRLYLGDEIGTDMNRARVLSKEGRDLFLKTFLDAIPADFVATTADGQTYRPADLPKEDVLNDRVRPDRQGYVAGPLDGIWARAPYLHNGSVPTLRHLLAPDNADSRRPAAFVRGLVEYDTHNVGFVWQSQAAADLRRTAPTAAVFDTGWDGASRHGHDRAVAIDGKNYHLNFSGPALRSELEDLLEFLKTL